MVGLAGFEPAASSSRTKWGNEQNKWKIAERSGKYREKISILRQKLRSFAAARVEEFRPISRHFFSHRTLTRTLGNTDESCAFISPDSRYFFRPKSRSSRER